MVRYQDDHDYTGAFIASYPGPHITVFPLEEKHKNNPLVTPEVTFHIKSVYQRILFYWNPGKILRMRERLVPGPYLSPSAPARVKGPGYEANS